MKHGFMSKKVLVEDGQGGRSFVLRAHVKEVCFETEKHIATEPACIAAAEAG